MQERLRRAAKPAMPAALIRALAGATVVMLLVAGCGGAKPPKGDRAPAVAASSAAPRDTGAGKDSIPLGPVKGVDGLTLGGDCPDAGPSADAEIAAQAAALIPLKVGLTLSHTWRGYDGDYDHECLDQVTAIDARSVVVSGSCPIGKDRLMSKYVRRLCRVDLRDSHLYVTERHESYPPTFRGSLQFSLSTASFAALKSTGETHHHYVDFTRKPFAIDHDIDGTLKSEGKGTFKIIINDRTTEVPTIEATHRSDEKHQLIRVKVLDDPRFPLMLDYYMPGPTFFITQTKVSFPTDGGLARQLATERHVDVYGIYFDFASDSIRRESEPVLREIAGALASNAAWSLTINGHTDSVGGAASNQDLSRRRSEAVRKALVERYQVDPARLSTNGFGSSQPKESNDTDFGRARNRRVELVRR